MNKSMMIRARIAPSLKESVESIFAALGMTASQAITLFYKQVELHRGIPFAVTLPNETTQRTLDESMRGEGLNEAKDVEDMFSQMGI